jgi:hypothetical protein
MKIILPNELIKGGIYYYPDMKTRGKFTGLISNTLCFETLKTKEIVNFPINTLFFEKEYYYRGIITAILLMPVMLFLCADIDILTPKQFWLFFASFLSYIGLLTLIFRNSNLLK